MIIFNLARVQRAVRSSSHYVGECDGIWCRAKKYFLFKKKLFSIRVPFSKFIKKIHFSSNQQMKIKFPPQNSTSAAEP